MSTLKEKAEEILQEKEEKIIPENLPSNVTVLGVTGNLIPLSEMGVLDMTMSGTNIVSYGNSLEFQANIDYGNTIIVPNNTGINIEFDNNVVANSIGLTPEKLKKDENVLGVTGTYEGSNEIELDPSYVYTLEYTTNSIKIGYDSFLNKTYYKMNVTFDGTYQDIITIINMDAVFYNDGANYYGFDTNLHLAQVCSNGSVNCIIYLYNDGNLISNCTEPNAHISVG